MEDADRDAERNKTATKGFPTRTSSIGGRRDKEKKRVDDVRFKSKKEGSRPSTAETTVNPVSASSSKLELPGIPKIVSHPVQIPEILTTIAISTEPQGDPDVASSRDSISDQSTVKSLRRDSFEFDRPVPHTRTTHAETYGSLDSSLIEYVRTRPDHHRTTELDTGTSFFRRLLRPLPRSTGPMYGITAGQTSAQLEGNYKPPWLAMAPRAKQEETDRVISNLNNSFKGVGLLPANTKPTPKSTKKGTTARPGNTGRAAVLDAVPDDSLFMLLPLWPGETDSSALAGHEAAPLAPALEERNYLLVYYVAFDSRKEPERRKKGTRHVQSSSTDVARPVNVQDSRSITLTEFHVAARLVGYNELRGTGVRLPSDGLSVTGPLWEAAQSIPDPATRLQGHGDVAIALCHSRERGIEFLPDGLVKMGLCLPLTPGKETVAQDAFGGGEEEIKTLPLLSPIGRAAVEMVWTGCMALSSFGPE